MAPVTESYPCACCGYLTLEEPPGSYAICPVCFWEDDALQLEFATTLSGGANRTTLAVAQRHFADFGACDATAVSYVREPIDAEVRDPSWRPVDPSHDTFESWTDKGHQRAPANDRSLYYWNPAFWRRS